MSIAIAYMLYVKDVNAIAKFWKRVGFVELDRQFIMDSETVVIAPSETSDARLQLFDIEFIKRVSPEVADNKPSLLMLVDELEKWHAKIKGIATNVGDIQDNGGKGAFNFSDPEGTYFAFGEK
jgi:predicted lactoylglutathione lyase